MPQSYGNSVMHKRCATETGTWNMNMEKEKENMKIRNISEWKLTRREEVSRYNETITPDYVYKRLRRKLTNGLTNSRMGF